jgi:hypothetical protein
MDLSTIAAKRANFQKPTLVFAGRVWSYAAFSSRRVAPQSPGKGQPDEEQEQRDHKPQRKGDLRRPLALPPIIHETVHKHRGALRFLACPGLPEEKQCDDVEGRNYSLLLFPFRRSLSVGDLGAVRLPEGGVNSLTQPLRLEEFIRQFHVVATYLPTIRLRFPFGNSVRVTPAIHRAFS